VPLPACHPMLTRQDGSCSEATPYSHYDNHDAMQLADDRRVGRHRPWLYLVAVVSAFALLFAYHEELRRALSVAEYDLRDGTGAISLEDAELLSGRSLKQQLRDITTRLSSTDRDQLGALVDAVVKPVGGKGGSGDDDVTAEVAQAMDDGASFGFRGQPTRKSKNSDECGPACMDALASKLPQQPSRHSRNDDAVLGMGSYNVGDELKYRRHKRASALQLKGAFMKSQVRKMDEAVKTGWKDLKEGKPADARMELKEAQEFHNSELRLMRGQPNIAKYLGTPKEIRKLRDGIDEAQGSIERTPGRLAHIIDADAPPTPVARYIVVLAAVVVLLVLLYSTTIVLYSATIQYSC